MVESNEPLIKDGELSTSESDWQELLKLDCDPDKKIYIRNIVICLSTYLPTTSTAIRVLINGTPYLHDFSPVVDTTTLAFGGSLIFEGKTVKPPIIVYVKSDGVTTLYATAIITGIKLPYKQIV